MSPSYYFPFVTGYYGNYADYGSMKIFAVAKVKKTYARRTKHRESLKNYNLLQTARRTASSYG